jgi:hypothetical protein
VADEAQLKRTDAGLVPEGEGWFVLNARESRWAEGDFGAGECLLLIEGKERPLKAWDFIHCPPWTEHVLVGAGTGPCLVLAVGSRTGGDVVYPAAGLAQKHGAAVQKETRDPDEAYASFSADAEVECREGWLPA